MGLQFCCGRYLWENHYVRNRGNFEVSSPCRVSLGLVWM